MGTGRKLQKKPMTRPRKSPLERRRRDKNHRDRLVALGMSDEDVRRMTSKEIRQLLQRPERTKAAIQASSSR
jgi:hypothetical protein